MSTPTPKTPTKPTKAEEIIAFRKKWLRRVTNEGSDLKSGKKIRQNLPCCPCHADQTRPNPCNDCVEFFLEKQSEHTTRITEQKLDMIDKANTKQVKELRLQLANNDNEVVEKLRKVISTREQEAEQLKLELTKLKEAHARLEDQYSDRVNEGITDEGRIEACKKSLETERTQSRVLHENAMVIVNYITILLLKDFTF